MMNELKPCPFCGGKAKISEMDIGDCNPKTYYSVSCGTEGCWVYENQDYWEDDTKEVADRWNTRPAETQAIERTKAECVEAVKNIQNPYPSGVSSITNDNEYARVIKNPSVRTAVSWYLAGRSFGLYQHNAIEAIKNVEVK